MKSSISYLTKDIVLGVLEIENGRDAEIQGELQLLKLMLGYDVVLNHNEVGKPLIDGYNISISHTKGFVAILLSKEFEVGIDIEYTSDRIKKIKKRFLRNDEIYTTTNELLITWCAKEAAYKLFSEEKLAFQEMKVIISDTQLINLKTNKTIDFISLINPKYTMVVCWINK
ncbi:4'-phosphopantetheinyl transferase superfamily protein [Prevotella aurantiaca]|jgi:4'-phosphopantetheinyl transferase family protein|uniref:4'-phosphopantetheinyl transferase superfamily protein n=1 Tax=Prevotella aurantiaca TaxID=596085 RepID=A0A930HMB6_9BACT|nr:4'-phosphopantetheinyl transferase superfamily protein [Prevotella aurantiaca]MBF1384464.1 4'-phosphopantetheinyl transferase superfamily protein [Prevotella aurantiaca]MBF1385853.1 4'-phosphopantetheinyl transferase superfamily protein [Prevotella aurantiaca]